MKPEYDLTILIPVYNEIRTIEEVLDKTSRLEGFKYEIIIVDDASNDGSPEVIKAWSEKNKGKHIQVITHDKNRGKGAAIATALTAANGQYFVIQDADLEYNPAEIKRLLNAADGTSAVYGSRFKGTITGMRWTNRVANRLYNIILLLLYGKRVSDMHTCYKMVPTKILRELEVKSHGFDYATEIVSKLLLNRVPIKEVPISYHGRTIEEGKKIGWKDGFDCFVLLVQYRVFGRPETLFDAQWIRFLFVGGAGFVTNFAVLFLLHGVAKLPLLISQIVAVEISIIVTFLLHHHWTYRQGGEWLTKLGKYNLSASLGAILNTALLWLLTVKFGFYYLISLSISAAVVMVWNYVINDRLIWRKHAKTLSEASAVTE